MLIFTITGTLFADTVYTKDGKTLKGLVVDEYADRITLSTVDGEKDILRGGIERIEYDAPELNFIQLGRDFDAKGWYEKASFYYKKAMEINPDNKEAREAYLASHAKMWRQEERMTKKELARQGMVMDWWKNKYKKQEPKAKDKSSLLKETVGISLEEKEGTFIITDTVPYSSAYKSEIREGDLLVGIWGDLVRYSSMEDVLDELLGPKYSEVRVLIEKKIVIMTEYSAADIYDDLGILLGFEYEGLVVKETLSGKIGESSGFRQGDLIMTIDGNSTRYLSMDSVIALIRSAKSSKELVFTVRRRVNLRREGK